MHGPHVCLYHGPGEPCPPNAREALSTPAPPPADARRIRPLWPPRPVRNLSGAAAAPLVAWRLGLRGTAPRPRHSPRRIRGAYPCRADSDTRRTRPALALSSRSGGRAPPTAPARPGPRTGRTPEERKARCPPHGS
ncbi:hypothetical protein GCM10009834_05650 [Streptomonospora arabica]